MYTEIIDYKAFPEGGIYIMRSERIYIAAVCHHIGVNGKGPHKHNDWLSFELCVDGQPIIIDPGTYCYTGNIEKRRLFRSTAYHNTVVIDGEEQTPIHESIFSLVNPSGQLNILRWESNEQGDLLEAEHTGYADLSGPVIHRRCFYLDKSGNNVTITDNFVGEGKHSLAWYFHLETDLLCRIADREACITKMGKPLISITCSNSDVNAQLRRGWISRSYNNCEPANVICFHNEVEMGKSFQCVLKFVPVASATGR